MPQTKYVSDFAFLKYYTPKAQQKIAEILPEIEAAIDAGETGGRAVISWEAAFSKYTVQISDFKYIRRNDLLTQQLTEKNMPYEYQDKSEDEKAAIAKEMDVINNDFIAVRELFAKIDKVEVLGKKEREAKARIKKDWTPAADMLNQKLKEIIAATITEFKKQVKNGKLSQYKETWDFLQNNQITTYMQFRDAWRKSEGKREIPDLGIFHKVSSGVITGFVDFFPEEHAENEATKYAEREGNDTAAHFVSKNLDKLVSLLKKKTLVDIKVHGLSVRNSAIHSSMDFTFNDGSSFEVRNQLVYGYSNRGRAFVKYPTTFHDVMVEGKPMSQPSELKVYDVFSGEKPSQE
jgi:hypothetical protein